MTDCTFERIMMAGRKETDNDENQVHNQDQLEKNCETKITDELQITNEEEIVENDINFIDYDELADTCNDNNINNNINHKNRSITSKRVKSRLIKKPFKSRKQSKNGQVIVVPPHHINFADVEKIVFKHLTQPITKEMIFTISKQIGFIPTNLVNIAYTNPMDPNHPFILQLYPLTYSELYGWDKPKENDRKQFRSPFPTMFWISCPILHAKVAQLEQEGWIPIINEKLLSNEEELLMMAKAHQLYQEERWSLLNEEDQEYIIQNGWLDPIKNVGIAGIRDFRKVKCFHGHYAHYLARPSHNNIIGQWVHQLLTNLEKSEFALLKPNSNISSAFTVGSEK